jgi:DNA-binding GntR family transcriptional regulator
LLVARDDACAGKQWSRFVEIDADFHHLVVVASHNKLLAELHSGLTEVIKASIEALDSSQPDTRKIDHRGLLFAIRDRDPDRAVQEAGGFLAEALTVLAENSA